MRISARASKIISQRDFVSCFRSESTEDSALWIGTHCDVSTCPHAPKLVRAEQNILAMYLKKATDNTCVLTQITSVSFKGMILQSIIDSQMNKSLSNYAQDLTDKVNDAKAGRPTVRKTTSSTKSKSPEPKPKEIWPHTTPFESCTSNTPLK